MTFSGRSTDADGHLVSTRALVFYADNEGLWVDVPGFAEGLTMTVPNPAAPFIALDNTAIRFAAKEGGVSPPSQVLSISNSGGGTLSWAASTTAPWLSVSPGIGKDARTITLTVNSAALTVGTYLGSLTVTALEASNSPQTVGVKLVVDAKPALKSIALTPATATINIGATQQFTATGTYTDGSTQNLTTAITWSSSSNAVAMISSTGLASAIGKGTSNILAVSGSISATATLTVTPAVTSLTVTPAATSLAKGLTLQLKATGTYSDGMMQDLTTKVTWTSASQAVAAVSTVGKVTAKTPGTTRIQATSGTYYASATVTVIPAILTSIAIRPTSPTLLLGSTTQFSASGMYSDGTSQDLSLTATWSSSDSTVAPVTGTGLVRSLAAGSANVQAAYGSIIGTTRVTIVKPLSGLVGSWQFDEPSGSTSADASGNGYTATLVNGPSFVAGRLGNAISADGRIQFVSLPAIDLNSTPAVTIAMWVNRTYSSGGGHTLIEASTNFNSSNTGFAIFPDDADCGAIMVALRGNTGYSVNCYAQPSSGAWHHLVAVFDKSRPGSGETAFYLDGVLQQPLQNYLTADNTNAFGKNATYLFSRGGTSEFSAGMVDDLRLYNRALTSTEVQQLFAGTAAPSGQ